jgi:hypothetical protein
MLGAIRILTRVPVWYNDAKVTESILADSPRSYVGRKRMIAFYLDNRMPKEAFEAARLAASLYDRDATIYVTGSIAAFAAGDPKGADSLLAGLERLCHGGCVGYYRHEADVARTHGYPDAADSLLARAARFRVPS